MAFAYDPQIEAVLAAVLAAFGPMAPAKRGDWKTLRANIDVQMAAMGDAMPPLPEVVRTEHRMETVDGAILALRWYTKPGAATGSAVLYLHGGGMICGSVDIYDRLVAAYVAASGVPMLAAEYRLAPEYPRPVPVEDSYAALRWLSRHAARLGVDPGRLAVMGDSAGGGLAAGVALLARDRNLPLARQILIYPMLDDRNMEPDPALAPLASWTYDDNFTGWHALLGDALGTDRVPPSAAPSRARDLAGVAPAYVEVGELDIFRDENIEYARRLSAAGISAELHVHPGMPHGYDRMIPDSDFGRRIAADRLRVLAAL